MEGRECISIICVYASVCAQSVRQHSPLRGKKFSLCISSTAGTRNAKVLPLPVRAAPMRSLHTHTHTHTHTQRGGTHWMDQKICTPFLFQ